MSYTRGALLIGRFRTWRDLATMSADDQRNTLIAELAARTTEPVDALQARNDLELAGAGALYVVLRTAGIRDEAALASLSIDDLRNVMITELAALTGEGQRQLQSLTELDLAKLALRGSGGVRGVLLLGGFRSWEQLNALPADDQRNTLIAGLVHLCRQDVGFFQGMDDATLAGCGAMTVLLRDSGIRSAAALATMTADDQRNTLIVEIDGFTHEGRRLQGHGNGDLVRIALGDRFVLRTSRTVGRDGPDRELFLPPISVRYRGLRCYGESDWDGDLTPNEDEPYVGMAVSSLSGTATFTSPRYTEVDAGDTREDLIEIYRGEARGLGLQIVLFEHDFADPAAMEKLVRQGADKAAAMVAGALIGVPGPGPYLAAAFAAAWAEYGDDVVTFLNGLFDFGDEVVGTTTLFLSDRQLRQLATAPWQQDGALQFKIQSPLVSGDGSSYKAVFDVVIAQ